MKTLSGRGVLLAALLLLGRPNPSIPPQNEYHSHVRISGRRLAPAVVGAAGFVLLCVASLRYHPASSGDGRRAERTSPDRTSISIAKPGEAIPPSADSLQDRPWFLQGDPTLIARVIAEIDEAQRQGRDARELHERLKREMGNLLGQNGVQGFPLLKRIICDPTLPTDLKSITLAFGCQQPFPETALFLANLISEGKVASDVQADAIAGLERMYSGSLRDQLSDSLKDAGRRAYEAMAASTDPRVRGAAVSTLLTLGSPANPEETLLALFRDDPVLDVVFAATGLLRRIDSTRDNQPLASEMEDIVRRSDDYWRRSCALSILIETGTDLARKTVLACLADPDAGMRLTALGGVVQFKLTETIPLLDEWLFGSDRGDETTRLYCITTLKALPTLQSARVLLREVMSEEDASLQYRAVTSLQEHPAVAGEEMADELIRRYQAQMDTPVGEFLLEILAKNETRRAFDVLTATYEAATPEKKTRVASIILGNDQAPAFAVAHFDELMKTENADLVIRSAAKADPAVAVGLLAKAWPLGTLTESTRLSVVAALEEMKSAKSLEVLQGFLKPGAEFGLRRHIEKAIERILDDP